MKAIVYVDLKTGVLDPQGKAISETLGRLGFDEVTDARIGKRIELDLAGTPIARRQKRASKKCAKACSRTQSLNAIRSN